MNKNQFVLAAFMDMTSAYDLVTYDKIEEVLTKRNADSAFIVWFMDLLRNRTITLENKGIILSKKANRGLMQGRGDVCNAGLSQRARVSHACAQVPPPPGV